MSLEPMMLDIPVMGLRFYGVRPQKEIWTHGPKQLAIKEKREAIEKRKKIQET